MLESAEELFVIENQSRSTHWVPSVSEPTAVAQKSKFNGSVVIMW